MKKTVKGKRGITLVALVITIIVLLILAGITINLTVGQGGILNTAEQAGKNYVASAIDEQADLDDLTNYLNAKITEVGEKVEDLTKTVTVDGVETTVTIGEKISDGTGATVPVPTGFFYVGGTVEKGAVISDNVADKNKYKGQEVVGTDLEGNQYVFVSCTIDGANGTLQYARTTSWDIENDYDTLACKDELTLTDASDISKEIVAQINDEMASVKTYKGYYIGRYEVGNVSDKAVIKANVEPYTDIRWSTAYTIAKEIGEGDYATTYLCSSYAWDTAINFIQNNGATNYATTITGFNENWLGCDVISSEGKVINKDESGNAIRLNTGLTTAKSNIYDMGGNVAEMTTELIPGTSEPVVLRGGFYISYSSAGRRIDSNENNRLDYFGLRATLFIK